MSQTQKHGLTFITPEGGIAISLTNRTGSSSIKGQVVRADLSNNSSFYVNSPSDMPIGVVYEAGVANGNDCLVVVSGLAQILLEDAVGSSRGDHLFVSSSTAGRADSSAVDNPASLGRSLQTISGGTSVLCNGILQIYNMRNDGAFITADRGFAVKLTNKTGAASVRGTIVSSSSSVADAVELAPADCKEVIGVIYEDDIADGSEVAVVVAGRAFFLLENNTSTNYKYWLRSSLNQEGRVDGSNDNPPGGGIPQADQHFAEVGHSLQAANAGIDVGIYGILHCN